jgi:hypothetical protein
LLRRRLSSRAATAVTAVAVVAAAVTVTPSFAGTYLVKDQKKTGTLYLTEKRASKTYLTNKKASGTYLKKKAAGNVYLAKADAPFEPVAAIAAGSVAFNAETKTAGYIPSAFTSFATKSKVSNAVIQFSGSATCVAEKAGQACPIEILVDGQKTGKQNFALSTAASASEPKPIVNSLMLTTVLTKGGHTVSVQYAGAEKVSFKLSNWNLSVQAYPQPEEPLEESAGGETGTATK